VGEEEEERNEIDTDLRLSEELRVLMGGRFRSYELRMVSLLFLVSKGGDADAAGVVGGSAGVTQGPCGAFVLDSSIRGFVC